MVYLRAAGAVRRHLGAARRQACRGRFPVADDDQPPAALGADAGRPAFPAALLPDHRMVWLVLRADRMDHRRGIDAGRAEQPLDHQGDAAGLFRHAGPDGHAARPGGGCRTLARLWPEGPNMSEHIWPILMLAALIAGIFTGYPVAFV